MRVAFYKAVATFVRAFAEISSDMNAAGYTQAEADAIRAEVDSYSDLRAAVKRCACEELDTKPFEADMRHLINTYIQAEPVQGLAGLANLSLTDLIIKTGIHDAIARKLNEKGKLSKDAVAETIINNVRKTIIRERLTDPRFYEQMSKLLDDLIKQRRSDTAEYEEFLRKAEELVRRLAAQEPAQGAPAVLHGKREATVLFNNLASLPATTFVCPDDAEVRAALANQIDSALRERAPAGWKGDQAREAQVLNAIFPLLSRDREATLALFEIVKNQAGY
jgi:type I restriction enzyme R subunit